VWIPHQAANAVIAELLEKERKVPVKLGRLGGLAGTVIGPLTAIPHRVVLRPAEPGKIRFLVEVEILEGNETLAIVEMETDVQPQLSRRVDGMHLSFGISAQDLSKVRPRLGASARAHLAGLLVERLSVARKVPESLVERAVAGAAEWLGKSTFPLLRDTLLKRLGEISLIDVRLPDLPVRRVDLESVREPDAIALAITTRLPVRRGVPASPIYTPNADVTVRMSGSAVVEAANWAIARGHLPRDYERNLKPRDGGKYRPILDWRHEDSTRPLAVHVFQQRGGCTHIRIGARPGLALDGDELVASIHDRKIELVQGTRTLRLGAWLKSLVSRSVDQSRRAAAHTEVTVGGEKLQLRLTEVGIDSDQLQFSFRVGIVQRR